MRRTSADEEDGENFDVGFDGGIERADLPKVLHWVASSHPSLRAEWDELDELFLLFLELEVEL